MFRRCFLRTAGMVLRCINFGVWGKRVTKASSKVLHRTAGRLGLS